MRGQAIWSLGAKATDCISRMRREGLGEGRLGMATLQFAQRGISTDELCHTTWGEQNNPVAKKYLSQKDCSDSSKISV